MSELVALEGMFDLRRAVRDGFAAIAFRVLELEVGWDDAKTDAERRCEFARSQGVVELKPRGVEVMPSCVARPGGGSSNELNMWFDTAHGVVVVGFEQEWGESGVARDASAKFVSNGFVRNRFCFHPQCLVDALDGPFVESVHD